MNPERPAKPRRPGAPIRPVPPPDPVPAKKGVSIPILWLAIGAVGILIVAAVILTRPSGQPPAAPPPVARKTESPPPPPPPAVKLPAPVDPGPEAPVDRMRWLRRLQSKTPEDFKRWHGEWSALLLKVAGTAEEQGVREELELLEGAAHKEFRARFRPVREKINELTAARKTREAILVLREWKIPEGLDLKGGIRADLDGEINRLTRLADLDEAVDAYREAFKQGQDPGDPKKLFAEYLKSADIGIRMPAEYAVRSLIVLQVSRRLRGAMDARRDAAEARLEKLRQEVAAEGEARRVRIKAWERRLQEKSRASPLPAKTLGMAGTMQFRILGFDGNNLAFGNSSVELKTSLSELSSDAYGRILEMAADPADAEGLIEAGRLAIRAGALDAADRLIRAAVRARPAYEAMAPSVARLRAGPGALGGRSEIVGDRVVYAYEFDRPEEAAEFTPFSAVESSVRNGELRLKRGDGFFLADAGGAAFSGRARLKVRTAGVEGSAAHAFGFRWEVAAGESDLLLVIVFPQGWRVVTLEGAAPPKTLQEAEFQSKVDSFELELKDGAAELKVGGKPLWSGTTAANTRVTPIVGGAAIEDAPDAAVSYASVELQGRGAPEWIRTIRSARRARVEAELSKEIKALEAAEITQPLETRDFGLELEKPLPLEETLKDAFTDEARRAFAEWRAELKALEKARTPEEALWQSLKVERAIETVVSQAGWLPLSYYHRAEWKHLHGDYAGALADLDESLARHEFFVEAHIAKADLFAELGRTDDAAKSIDAALEAAPDLAEPRLTRALLHYYADRADAAVQELELAMRLAPKDIDLRLAALRLSRVVSGPRWPAEAKIDTEHYQVRAEVSAASPKEAALAKERAERAARTLEITRRWFEELVPGQGRRARKPLVYIFQSPESYYVHADLAHGDRLEYSAGVYIPQYQQLMFYLDESEEETRATMIHESFHEYLGSLAPAAPPWLNEGYAQYVSGVRIEGDRVAAAGELLPARVATLRRALKRGFKGVPFEVFMRESQQQFMEGELSTQYAQAWSMVHFLIHYEQGRYRAAFTAYVKGLTEGKAPGPLLASAFKGLDLKKLQEEWLEYIKKW